MIKLAIYKVWKYCIKKSIIPPSLRISSLLIWLNILRIPSSLDPTKVSRTRTRLSALFVMPRLLYGTTQLIR